MINADELQKALSDLGPWLVQHLEVAPLESRVWEAGPLGAAYQWQDLERHERFLLSLKLTSNSLKILNLWLPSSKRNQGLGTRIVNHLVSLCQEHRIPAIVIEPRPDSEPFWAKRGFGPNPSDKQIWRRNVT